MEKGDVDQQNKRWNQVHRVQPRVAHLIVDFGTEAVFRQSDQTRLPLLWPTRLLVSGAAEADQSLCHRSFAASFIVMYLFIQDWTGISVRYPLFPLWWSRHVVGSEFAFGSNEYVRHPMLTRTRMECHFSPHSTVKPVLVLMSRHCIDIFS